MRALLPCLLAISLAAADPPPVPDPIGLGERLALIDHLQERYHLRLPGDPTIEQLREAYRRAWAAAQPAASVAVQQPESEAERSASAERAVRLRALIQRRHGVDSAPGLDERALQDELHRLDAAKAERDAAAVAALAAADATAPRPAAEKPEAGPQGPAEAESARPTKPSAAAVAVRMINFPASGVTACALVQDGGVSALLVVFGSDHNGAFKGMPQGMIAALHGSPGIHRAVLLLGHGTGNSIAGEPIEGHLKANRTFYETLGGTAAQQPIECLVFASCSAGNPNQMAAMRDGLGYYPTWRVATGANNYANNAVILSALQAVAQRPASPAWRGLYRYHSDEGECSCFGEVGAGGERAETKFYRIVVDASKHWKVEEQR